MAIYAFISVLVVSLISLVGIFTISADENRLRNNVFILVSLAVGALLGDAFIHIIPEAFESGADAHAVALYIIIGIIIFLIIEKFLHWHHHGDDKQHNHVHPVGKLIIISDGVHNFIDGLIIVASYAVSPAVGIATTLAVILHEIPQEIGDFGVLIHAGYTKKRALWLNFLSALCAFVGVGVGLLIGNISNALEGVILPIAAGGFIYIALSDLIPELQKTKDAKRSVIQLIAVITGILAMLVLVLFH